MEKVDILLKNTIGFGDSMNSREMLKIYYYGVATGNISEELKQYAHSICESIHEDGGYHE